MDSKYPTFTFCWRVCTRFFVLLTTIQFSEQIFQICTTVILCEMQSVCAPVCQRHPSISESFVSRVAVLSEFLYMTSFHMTFNSVTHFFGWHVIKSLKMRQNELPHCQQTLKKSSSLQIRDQICVVHITMAVLGDFCPKSIWDKSQFELPRSKKSEKLKALLVYQLLKLIK